MTHDSEHFDPGAHEPAAINTRAVLVASIILAIIVIGAVWSSDLIERKLRGDHPPEAKEALAPESGPHKARLTHWEDPAADLAELRAREQKRLSGYDWIDREHKVVRIPIDRAMELLAARRAASESGR